MKLLKRKIDFFCIILNSIILINASESILNIQYCILFKVFENYPYLEPLSIWFRNVSFQSIYVENTIRI
jgi:hypothetical protein